METILKKIKEEFNAFVKEDKVKIKFNKFHNLQALSLLPATNIRKKMVKIEFIYFVKESGLDVKITYIKRNDEQKEIEKAFTFSQVTKDLSLPMIDNDIIDDIANSFKYEIFDGKLKSTISPENQATTFVRIIKNDWNSIINYLDIV